jgi:hypothetical protein
MTRTWGLGDLGLHVNWPLDFSEYKPYFNDILRVDGWEYASMLGLVNMSGIWHVGPHVNWSIINHKTMKSMLLKLQE